SMSEAPEVGLGVSRPADIASDTASPLAASSRRGAPALVVPPSAAMVVLRSRTYCIDTPPSARWLPGGSLAPTVTQRSAASPPSAADSMIGRLRFPFIHRLACAAGCCEMPCLTPIDAMWARVLADSVPSELRSTYRPLCLTRSTLPSRTPKAPLPRNESALQNSAL